MKLYENIKNLRIENGWSQKELANKVGYTDRSSIARIEAGEVDLPQSKVALFAKVFGVDPVDLIGFDDKGERMSKIERLYNMLEPDSKSIVMQIIQSLADKDIAIREVEGQDEE